MSVDATWPIIGSAIVSALDSDAFDHQTLGLIAYPQALVDPTSCLCDSALQGLCSHGDLTCCKQYIPGVTCGAPMLPQVPLADAQTAKASGTGVRHDIQQLLTGTTPISSADNGAPGYEAIAAAYAALRNVAPATRGALLLTASGFNCTSFASVARPGYLDGNSCPDWEEPDSVNALIASAYSDPTAPVRTVVVGLPGSDSAGQKTGSFDTAPYHMKLALSTYAVSGAPTAVDPSCSSGATFSQAGQDPTAPCHFDLSNATTFDANGLARAIAIGRQRIMGCTYDLPVPPSGQSIDPALVNVDLTLAGVKSTLLKRATPSDACTSDGCWDYASGKVQLIGLSCVDLLSASDGRVDVRVGCPTMTK
jgi:hypothetical protein